MVKVLIVEDDADLRGTLADCLGLFELTVHGVGSAGEAYRALAKDLYDIVVVDIGLPDEDGFSLAETLARRADLGIIILTARADLSDRLHGFDSGADAYFVKPVDCKELALAARNLARRLAGAKGAAQAGIKCTGAWSLDRSAWLLGTPGGRAVRLTSKEFALVERLSRCCGEPVRRVELIGALGYRNDVVAGRNLDAVVGRLRRKVAALSGGEELPVRTIHAIGYTFAAPIDGEGAEAGTPT